MAIAKKVFSSETETGDDFFLRGLRRFLVDAVFFDLRAAMTNYRFYLDVKLLPGDPTGAWDLHGEEQNVSGVVLQVSGNR